MIGTTKMKGHILTSSAFTKIDCFYSRCHHGKLGDLVWCLLLRSNFEVKVEVAQGTAWLKPMGGAIVKAT